LIDDHHLLLPLTAGAVVVDVGTGATRPAKAAESGWCLQPVSYPAPYLTAPSTGESAWHYCNQQGKPTDVRPLLIPKGIGLRTAGLAIIDIGTALEAIRA
jgi:hypothetical protein